jgi:hypothetical protein
MERRLDRRRLPKEFCKIKEKATTKRICGLKIKEKAPKEFYDKREGYQKTSTIVSSFH